ncbi:MAG: hypothetical protein ACFFCI_20355, partial [Promethearchaeota archaeon]
MYNSRKSKKILILLLLTITISFFEFNKVGWEKNKILVTPKSYSDYQPFDKVRTADYSPGYSNTGENVSIGIHQSVVNTTLRQFSNLDTNNRFKEICPTVNNFNSSFTNITINNIYAPNKTIIIEDDTQGVGLEQYFLGEYYTSFQTRGFGYLQNISILIK